MPRFTFEVLTFGCRVNQADSLACEVALAQAGGVPREGGQADLVVVNTCSVTASADQAARQAIRRIARDNPSARVVVTGCYATRQPAGLAGLPNVIRVVPNNAKDRLASDLFAGTPPAAVDQASTGPAVRPLLPRPGWHGRTTVPLRVQTGCDERCSYCAVPSTRGPSRSRPLHQVVADARSLAAAGYKELVVTGVHLGAYGPDLDPAVSLRDLLVRLDRLREDVSFRLSSLEPMDCTAGILDLLASSGRFAPHLHLPLQHASDPVLKAMRRPYVLAEFRALVDGIRGRFPDAAIGTDVISGFPGESEEDHEVLARYLAASGITHLHVFPYSERPGTEASRLSPKVPGAVARRRCEALRGLSRGLGRAFTERQLGTVRPGLTIEDGTRVVTDNYLKVRIAPGHGRNQRVRVRVGSVEPLAGEVVA